MRISSATRSRRRKSKLLLSVVLSFADYGGKFVLCQVVYAFGLVACWSKLLDRFSVFVITGTYAPLTFKENLSTSLKVHTCTSEA